MSVICAGPREDAAIHHRDFQSDAEGIVVGQLAEDTITYGTAGARKKDGPAVDKDTLFEIGSITKVFTGILLADSVLKGRASLEDPIPKHLPKDLLAPDSALNQVTLLDLATHTSGLPRLPANFDTGANPLDPYAH
jgi:CubicO group peptidase (beta-lactamase class C family)